MTQVVVADPAAAIAAAQPTAPVAPAAAAQPAPARTPDPEETDDGGLDLNLTPAQEATRRRRLLETSRDRWKGRATSAETDLAAARAQVASLQAQVGSVSQLRTSLLQTAIRAEAAKMIVPESIDDAVQLLQTSDLTVGDDGKIDQAKVKAKLEEFVKARPHLAPRASNAPQPLPGGHAPAPSGGGNGLMNELLRSGRR